VPHQYCPTCRLTVHAVDAVVSTGPCPRCGDQLADQPRELLASPPTGLDPEAVRMLLAQRGGRFQRSVGRSRGRSSSSGRRVA
jgi:hypothetical protein